MMLLLLRCSEQWRGKDAGHGVRVLLCERLSLETKEVIVWASIRDLYLDQLPFFFAVEYS